LKAVRKSGFFVGAAIRQVGHFGLQL
jgi:hypothetical protein